MAKPMNSDLGQRPRVSIFD